MFKEDDYIIESVKKDYLGLKPPKEGCKITHKRTGLTHCSFTYNSFNANKAECIYQILGAVRQYDSKYESIPFKFFNLILERKEV